MLLRLDGGGPLTVRIYRALRGVILEGRLRPGERLPSTRTLAAECAVSRNTVLSAYEQLLAEGYVTGRHGSGTYVTGELPDRTTIATRREIRPPVEPPVRRPSLSRFAARLDAERRARRVGLARRGTILSYDFRYGRPAFGDFPHDLWNRLLARSARRASARDLDYGPPGGVPALREAIADYLRRARGVVCRSEQVVVVTGSQQGLDLASRVLLDPGDAVLLEEPHYAGARRALAAAGVRMVAAPVDGEGLRLPDRAAGRARIRLAYVTPSHQFPTGVVMSFPRRLALLEWAGRAGAYVLEDDYDGEFRYAGRPIESLQGMDRRGRVLYLGTFSKLLFPALRLGYLVLPEALVGPFQTAKAVTDSGSAALEQRALADFILEGHFERHVRRSRAANAARRAALLAAIDEHLGDRVEILGADAGVHLLLWIRGVAAARVPEIVARASEAGVGVYPVSPYYLRPPRRAGLLLGYAGLTPADIRRGIERLGKALQVA